MYSPALAVATAAFELGAAAWVLKGEGRKPVVFVTTALLLFLAAYQIVEATLCSVAPGSSFLPRLAFMVVTWLPPLGVLLVSFLLGAGARVARGFAAAMLACAVVIQFWIGFDPSFARLSVCEAVYARYSHPTPGFLAYSGFYWTGLLGLVVFSGYGAARPRDPHNGRLARLVLTGSLAFLGPAVITVQLLPASDGALPSVMCHFAVILAVFLVRLAYLEQGVAADPQREASVPI